MRYCHADRFCSAYPDEDSDRSGSRSCSDERNRHQSYLRFHASAGSHNAADLSKRPSTVLLAKGIVKLSFPALIICVLIVIPSVLDERTPIGQDAIEITDTFGGASSLVLMVHKGNLAEEQAVVDEIEAIPNVVLVIFYVGTFGAEIPDNYSRMIITVDTSLEDPESFKAIEEIRATGETHYPGEWYLAGEIANAYDMKSFIEEDNLKIEAVGIIAICIVILLAFRSISLPLILVLVIKSAIWINCALSYFQGE